MNDFTMTAKNDSETDDNLAAWGGIVSNADPVMPMPTDHVVSDTVGPDGNEDSGDEPVAAGIVCPRLGTTGSGTVTIDNVRYEGPLYPNITTASTNSSVVAVQGGSFRNAHQDIFRDRIGVIDDSWFHNTTAGNRHGAALSLFDGSKTTITGSTFTNNSNTSGNGGAIGGSTASSIDSGGGSELTLRNCFFANNISTGQCGGAIYGSTNSQLTISGSTFTCNTANNYGGVIYATTRVKLEISDSVFSGNIVTKGNGGAIHLEREVSATITGSTFSGNTAGVKTAGLGGAITVCFNSSLFVSGCTFAGNIAYNYAGAIFVNVEKTQTTIKDCVFATKSDSIVIDTGTVIFAGTITLATDVRKESHPDRGHYSCSTDKADFVFINEESISIAKLDNAENIRSLSFRSTEMVNFTDLELSDTILNIDCELPSSGETLSIASGLTSLGSGTITVHGKNAVGGKAFFEGSLYKVYLSDNFLTITSEEYVRAAIVTSNGAEWVQVGSTNYAGKSYPSIDAALKQEDFVVMQGTFATRSSVTGAGKLAFIDKTDVTGNIVDDDGGAFMIGETGSASITASTFSRNHAKNGGAIVNDNGRLIISGSTFTENMANNGGAIYSTTGGTGSVENALFTGNVARETGGAVYCVNVSALSISGSTFTDNIASSDGGAIYLKSGTVNITDCVFSTTNDTVYNNGGVLTLGGTIHTAANITSTNVVTVESDTQLVLDFSVRTADTEELLTGFGTMFDDDAQNNLTISINVASDQAYGNYVLATGVNALTQKSFTITLDGDAQKSFTVSVGGTAEYDSKSYILQLVGDTLSLGIEIAGDTGIVTKNGNVNTVVIGGVTYTGNKYKESDIAQALSSKQVVAAQGVSYTETQLSVAAGKTFVAGTISMSGNRTAENGGTVFNSGTATIIDGAFADNAAAKGGAIYNAGTATVERSVFSGNAATDSSTADSGGGAIFNAGNLLIAGSTFSGNTADNSYHRGAAVYNTGKTVIRDSVFATASDTVYNAAAPNALLTIGGTITTAANFTSYSNTAVAVEENTLLVLDLSVYAGTTSKQLLTEYNRMFGSTQGNLSITVNVAANQAFGNYLLATDASAFDRSKTISVVCDGSEIGSFNLQSGTLSFVGPAEKQYTLRLFSNGDLSLSIEAATDTGIVTEEGNISTVVIGGVTYTGNKYVQCQLLQALAEKGIVAAQGVSVTKTQLAIGENQTFAADTLSLSGSTSTDLGGALYCDDNAFSTLENSVFFRNTADDAGGAICNDGGTVTVTGSTFSNNTAGVAGGAICNNSGTTTITGSTFTGNTAGAGGAMENEDAVSVLTSTFTGNTATETGGAVDNSGTATIADSVLSDNTAAKGGALYSTGTGTVFDASLTGNTALDSGGAVYVASGTTTIETVLFSGNAAGTSGGAVFVGGDGTADIYGSSRFTGNTATSGGAIGNSGGQITIGNAVFDGNTALEKGGAIYNSGMAAFSDSRFTGNTAEYGGAVYVSLGTATISRSTFTGNTATKGGAVFVLESAAATIRDSIFTTASDTIYNDGVLTLGGTIRTAANITSTKTITVNDQTQLVLDLSIYAGTTSKELLSGFSTMFDTAAQSHLTLSINVASDQAFGKYVLATGVDTLSQSSFTVTFGGDISKHITITVGGQPVMYDLKDYTLTLEEGTLSLDIKEVSQGIVTPNGDTDTVVIGGVTYTGEKYAQNRIDDAFNAKNIVAAQGVSYEKKNLHVSNNKLFVADMISISGSTPSSYGGAIYNSGTTMVSAGTFTDNRTWGNGGAIYNQGTATITGGVFAGNVAAEGGAVSNSGTATIRDSVFATASDTLYNNGILTLGGTITTAANITSAKEIRVEENTQLVLDLSVYAGVMQKELLTGYNVMFGASQSNLSITVNVSSSQTAVKYVLATGVESFSKTITVTVDGTYLGTVGVGGSIDIGGESFMLELQDGRLRFGLSYTGVVTENGDAETVVIGGVTYTGDKYAESQITDALASKRTVAAQGVSYENKNLYVSENKLFVADVISMSGGTIFNSGTATILNGVFYGNTATDNGGAIYNSGTATIRDSVFAMERDTVYSNGALTLGGTIWTAANITSTEKITVETDTELILDLSVYAGTTAKELLTDFDTMFGTSQSDLSITVDVGSYQTNGTYVLATEASLFGKDVVLSCGATTLGTFDCFTGGTTSVIEHQNMIYTLGRNDANDLTLTVQSNVAIYVNSNWEGLPEGTVIPLAGGGTAIFGTNAFATTAAAKKIEKLDLLVMYDGNYKTITAGKEPNAPELVSRALRVDGGTFGSVFGGNWMELGAEGMISYKANSNVEVRGGSIGTYLVAGDYVKGGIASYRTGNNTLAVSDGIVAGIVVGGNLFSDFKLADGSSGDVSMTLAGGTFTNRIYGGNACIQHSYSGGIGLTGDISITIDASQNALSIGENIVCGSYGSGVIHGNITLTVRGLGENLSFGANSTVSGGSGDGWYGYDQGKRVYDNFVDETSVASFDGFSGDFGAKIVLFDKLSFEGESAVHFTNNASYFTEIGQWSFAGNASVEFASAQKNDFKGDTLVIDTQGWDTSNPWTLLSGGETAFKGFDAFGSVTIGGVTAGWDGSQWTCDGGLTLSLNDESGKKSMILTKTS